MQNEQKSNIRKKILILLSNQKEEDRRSKSRIILAKLFKLSEFKDAKKVLFYASFGGEVETFEMMKQAKEINKDVILPKIIKDKKIMEPRQIESLEDGLEQGPYGIHQPKDDKSLPVDEKQLDLVIAPGVAFDKNNNRLGRGQGYYDRFLSRLSSDIPIVGLAFDFQIVDQIPHQEDHDVPVSQVITN